MRSVRSILAHGGQPIGGGYNLRGAGFPHHTPPPSQSAVSTFYLRVPPDLQFNQSLPNISKFEFKEPMDATWSSDHSAIYRNLHLYLTIANDISLAIGFTRISQKVNLMQRDINSTPIT
jgi:hypothetical protein